MKQNLELIFNALKALHLDAAFDYAGQLIDFKDYPDLLALQLQFQQLKRHRNTVGDIGDQEYLEAEKAIAASFVGLLEGIKQTLVSPKTYNLKSRLAPLDFFTGREEIMKQMENTFFVQNGKVVVLHGLDGMGKSRLAAEFAYAHWDNGRYKNAVWWVNASNPVTFESDLEGLVDRLNLSLDAGEGKIERLLRWLGTESHWLLIFDDCRDFNPILPLVARCRGNVLVTTSEAPGDKILPETQWIEVPALDQAASEALLAAYSKGRLSDQEKVNYLELCAGYPLLIELLGAFHSSGIRRKKLFSGEEYRAFISKKTEIAEKFFAITGLIRERIKVFNPRWPGDYLSFGITMWVLASFEGQKIPKSLLVAMAEEFTVYNEEKRFNAAGANWWQRIVARLFKVYRNVLLRGQNRLLDILQERSLIHETDQEHISVHGFIQLQFLDIAFRTDKWILRNNVIQFIELTNAVFYFNADNPKSLRTCREMLPHVASVIKRCWQAEFNHESVLKLVASMVEVLIFEGRFKTAKSYVAYAFELDEKTGRKFTHACQLMKVSLALIMGDPVDDVDQIIAHSHTAKNQNNLDGTFLKGLQLSALNDPQNALKQFESAIENANSANGMKHQLHLLYGLAAASAAEAGEEKSDQYCTLAIEHTDARFEENSFEHAKIYLLTGDVHKTKALAEGDGNLQMQYFHKAIEYYDRCFNIIEAREVNAALYSWLAIYGNMVCYYWLDDVEKTESHLVQLETALPKIKESLGEGHSIISDMEKIREWIDGFAS